MADYFVQKGYVVHMIDLRGFGYNLPIFIKKIDILAIQDLMHPLKNSIKISKSY
jgi:alpha-beta hydrolase superfamily lysophospholipase